MSEWTEVLQEFHKITDGLRKENSDRFTTIDTSLSTIKEKLANHRAIELGRKEEIVKLEDRLKEAEKEIVLNRDLRIKSDYLIKLGFGIMYGILGILAIIQGAIFIKGVL